MAQTYTGTGAITTPASVPYDQGQTLSLNNIGQTELNYAASIRTDAQLYTELQDFIGLWCRATTSGLSAVTTGSGVPAGPVSAREVITKLIFMLQAMQRTNEVYTALS